MQLHTYVIPSHSNRIQDTCPDPLFGRNVRKYRIRAGLTQEALGELSNLDRAYISGVERGERNPTLVRIKQIAVALDVPQEKLFKEPTAS